jgi:hypothetical protein
MTGILSTLGRNKQKKDPMRESAALTTVYLLEQNRKFEVFMRQKVEELETRVAAQQARLATKEEAEEQELWAALESFEEAEKTAAQEPVEDEDLPAADGQSEDEALDVDETPELVSPEEVEPMPDYLALMSGSPVEAETGVEDADDDGPEPTPAEAQETWPEQYESFQVVLPEAEAGDDLWPEMEGADELESLADPALEEGQAVEAPDAGGETEEVTTEMNPPEPAAEAEAGEQAAEQEQNGSETEPPDEISGEASEEVSEEGEDEDWQTSLPDGEKESWT